MVRGSAQSAHPGLNCLCNEREREGWREVGKPGLSQVHFTHSMCRWGKNCLRGLNAHF